MRTCSKVHHVEASKGIVATLNRNVKSIYPRGPRKFFCPSLTQAHVEQMMTLMGFGCRQYYLTFGTLAEVNYGSFYIRSPK